jgi:hypothetical protein
MNSRPLKSQATHCLVYWSVTWNQAGKVREHRKHAFHEVALNNVHKVATALIIVYKPVVTLR